MSAVTAEAALPSSREDDVSLIISCDLIAGSRHIGENS